MYTRSIVEDAVARRLSEYPGKRIPKKKFRALVVQVCKQEAWDEYYSIYTFIIYTLSFRAIVTGAFCGSYKITHLRAAIEKIRRDRERPEEYWIRKGRLP